MDGPVRTPSDAEIATALEAVRRIGGDVTEPETLATTADMLAEAARLAAPALERIADEMTGSAQGGPAISAVHDAFLACAVIRDRAAAHLDPVLGALEGESTAKAALLDIAARAQRGTRLFALLPLPDGRTPVCVAAPARQTLAWPLSDAARREVDAGPRAVVVMAFMATCLQQFAALLQNAFGLTAAEARLAATLVDAPTINEAAERLGVAPVTVKERMRDLLEKTGATRRSSLAARFTELVAGDYTRTHARAELMREAFGLTRAEAKVAEAVAEGLTTPEIARQHGVSPHTVRSQLDSTLARTGAHRGADLARIVAETCALAAWTSGGEPYPADQRRLIAATRLIVRHDRRRVAAADFGPPDGAPVLHFHPNLCFRWVRRAFADALAERGLRSIGYDRAGCGLSDPAAGHHPFETAAEDAAAVLAAYRISRVRLFAGLGGAAAAIAFATRYPDMVESAVMLMPRAPSEEPVFAGPIQRFYSGVLSMPGTGERFADALRRTGSTRFWRWLQSYMLRDVPADAETSRDPAFLEERLGEMNAAISRGVKGLYAWEQAYKAGWPRPARVGGRHWTIVETAAKPFKSTRSVQDTWAWLPGARFVKLHDAGRLATHTHAPALAGLLAGDRTTLGSVRLTG
ncbi:MAG: alpha/beta fold hydrolase [Alphaproteobacteria bacterium]|nr:alpha/beta fold hydrolase [Alphaproteobacteria bacterium]